MKKYKSILIPTLCAATVILLLRCIFFVGYVPTESMEPTIPKGSNILGYRIYGKLCEGDIIIFMKDGNLFVKRIAAVSGDVIKRDGGNLTVPINSFYVLGDNRGHSYDSRFWQDPFVENEDIIAKFISHSFPTALQAAVRVTAPSSTVKAGVHW